MGSKGQKNKVKGEKMIRIIVIGISMVFLLSSGVEAKEKSKVKEEPKKVQEKVSEKKEVADEDSKLKSPVEKISYALGLEIGKSLKRFETDIDVRAGRKNGSPERWETA